MGGMVLAWDAGFIEVDVKVNSAPARARRTSTYSGSMAACLTFSSSSSVMPTPLACPVRLSKSNATQRAQR